MAEDIHERMERYEELASRVVDATSERDAVAEEIEQSLVDAVADAVEVAGVNIAVADRSQDGRQYQFTARLDRAALVAALTDSLPAGFVVSHVNDDGSLNIEWTGTDRTPSKRRHGAVLKAIVAEATRTDGDGLIESVPPRSAVLDRAAELGIDREDAADRLGRLVTLDVIDIADGKVYPDTNFSRY